MSPYPLGVYHEPPPDEVGFISSYDVGGSIPAGIARRLTSATNDVLKLYNGLLPGP